MNGKVLVTYATSRGSTLEVAEAVAETLAERALDVDVRLAAGVKELDPYGAVVLGGALYMGRLHSDAVEFLHRYRHVLASLPVAVFAMGPRTLAPGDVADSRSQLDRALAMTPDVVPLSIAIFGGVVDPSKLKFPLNRMHASDARDWEAIRAWANEVASELGRVETAISAASADRLTRRI